MSYTLTDFFKEYMFKGKLNTRKTEFALDIFEYDPETGLFIASGDETGKLSAIIGKIIPDTEIQSGVEFRQIFTLNYKKIDDQVIYRGHLIKTKQDGVLNANREDTHDYLDLIVYTKGNDLAYMDWMDRAMEVELPTKGILSEIF